MMLCPCPKCSGREFSVSAVYVATDYIRLDANDSDDFDIINTDYGDGDWEDDSIVHCQSCGWESTYPTWRNLADELEVTSNE